MRMLALFCAAAFFVGCTRMSASSDADRKAPVSNAEIEALIEQLAISNEPAGQFPILSPRKDTPAADPRMIAYNAAKKLRAYGKQAFPHLLKHLDDHRQSVAFRNVIPHDVRDACYCIIRWHLFPLPEDYEGSIYRVGADGEPHERAYFSSPQLVDYNNLGSWLADRSHESLEQMQIEALEWLIDQEKAIGFQDEADKDSYLHPLERQVARIKESMTQLSPYNN